MTKAWDYTRSARIMALELAEGEPGALFVTRSLLSGMPEDIARDVFTFMATMDMRGQLIFLAYDHCGKNIQTFLNRVSSLDTTLVDSVNAENERTSAPGRCVHDGAIQWPEQLPVPSEIRRIAALLG